MEKTFTDDFDLEVIANSGQCFRFNTDDGINYTIISSDKMLHAASLGSGRFSFDCSKKDFDSFWSGYFDLETDYSAIRKLACNNDFLKKCADRSVGMRILKQDKWEMTVSFIISQRKSIPAIKTSIERLCRVCGREIGDGIYSFPTPREICRAPVDKLAECGLGYRLSYIREAADLFYAKKDEFERLSLLDDEELLSELKKMQGVGDKVASCIALFGFHRLNFFPKDVWINRALEEHFPLGFDHDAYNPYNGVMQQYIFYAYRNSKRS